MRIELMTFALLVQCSTTKLQRLNGQKIYPIYCKIYKSIKINRKKSHFLKIL